MFWRYEMVHCSENLYWIRNPKAWKCMQNRAWHPTALECQVPLQVVHFQSHPQYQKTELGISHPRAAELKPGHHVLCCHLVFFSNAVHVDVLKQAQNPEIDGKVVPVLPSQQGATNPLADVKKMPPSIERSCHQQLVGKRWRIFFPTQNRVDCPRSKLILIEQWPFRDATARRRDARSANQQESVQKSAPGSLPAGILMSFSLFYKMN